jgi:hypothetical protein
MNSLPNSLSPLQLKLDDLLLDPNNPRFSELGEELNPVPEGRFADEKVQSNTVEKMIWRIELRSVQGSEPR